MHCADQEKGLTYFWEILSPPREMAAYCLFMLESYIIVIKLCNIRYFQFLLLLVIDLFALKVAMLL